MADLIDIKCLQCGKSFRVKPEFAGKKAKCSVCGKVITIPDPANKAETLTFMEDVSSADVRRMAKTLAAGTGPKVEVKKGFFARLFGKK